MIKVSPDWWKGFFNETYLLTDARSVANEELTRREVNLIEKLLGLRKSDYILDLCGGQGRHSLELARRGYAHLTVLDYSDYLIELGKRKAEEEARSVKFSRADARFSGLKDEVFAAIIVMANSFGYFLNLEDNRRVLSEVNRLLKGKGRLLLDIGYAPYLLNNLKARSRHKVNADITVLRERELDGLLVKTRESVFSRKNGLICRRSYSVHIYDEDKIREQLKAAGFKDIRIKKDVSLHAGLEDYGFLGSRMFVIAGKN